jgi:high-affinity iron transporter
MLAAAVIAFREVLEAALVVAIVLGASVGVARRGRWVAAGVALGAAGAGVVAYFASGIAQAFSGTGQALLDAAILLFAVAMLAWHNIWMSTHARQLSAEIRALGEAVKAGRRSLAALLVISFVAVMREGSELVLFLWAIAASGARASAMTAGALGGIAGGALVGVLLYRSLLFISVRHFFRVIGWLILLLSAGLAAQAAGFLSQVNLLPTLGTSLWNTSGILSQGSVLGQLLHILVGYIARPSGIELLFYVSTLVIIYTLMRVVAQRSALGATGSSRTGEARA